ncbi:glutamate racemase [Gracilimonas mengyeensis]|uniref:Glutamate racemase n=1 Tax=Gracilimonas mengyeensis TaxID=1302730 RepID=A0A521F5P5_9BACT|nr:glutamate racemase [Gracilimonas mengyeensis]SMO91453.1 glutamate racemase [Gracilimonas mengyeensis]
MITKSQPIGIFDSGIGGLTVAKAVIEALPNEDIIYFGDTARVPYGIKSEETVRAYALEITRFLLKRGVKMILIACNTVSASAKKEIIEAAGEVPVLDVITSGTQKAVSLPNHQHVGVIGTLGTVNSQAYVKAIQSHDGSIEVSQQACPLLVPLAEEGWIDNDVAVQTLHHYLDVFKGSGIQSLILGCTHYPLFKEVIPKVMNGEGVEIIDSAESIAASAKTKLQELNLLNKDGGDFHCFVSDRPQRFHELAERFLGRDLKSVDVVSLD